MSQATTSLCCPPFDPAPWDDQELVWQDRRFLKGRIRSFLHIPLNFAAVLKRAAATLDTAGARPERPLVLVDENSLWGADLYMEASRDVPGVALETLSGTFLTRVFEGPYRNIPQWVEQMKAHVQARRRTLQKLWFHYPTCPRCAKACGKNHVVLLAQVEPAPMLAGTPAGG